MLLNVKLFRFIEPSTFTRITSSYYDHHGGKIVNLKESGFVVGGGRSEGGRTLHAKTEIVNLSSSSRWTVKTDYKYSLYIHHYAALSIGDSVYIFGGVPSEKTVAVYKNNEYFDAGSLLNDRSSHGVILKDSHVYVIGGSG